MITFALNRKPIHTSSQLVFCLGSSLGALSLLIVLDTHFCVKLHAYISEMQGRLCCDFPVRTHSWRWMATGGSGRCEGPLLHGKALKTVQPIIPLLHCWEQKTYIAKGGQRDVRKKGKEIQVRL